MPAALASCLRFLPLLALARSGHARGQRWPGQDDIHFDFYNSNNRYKEIVADHVELQCCRRIVTGLRSNFGTTAAYCSSFCDEIILYDRDFRTFNTNQVLVLKEFPDEADRLGGV